MRELAPTETRMRKSTKIEREAPAKVDDRSFPTKGVIAGNDHRISHSTSCGQASPGFGSHIVWISCDARSDVGEGPGTGLKVTSSENTRLIRG
jgi:hypothetical protein